MEHAHRTNLVGRGDKRVIGVEQAELPVDAIHVQREVEQVDHRIV